MGNSNNKLDILNTEIQNLKKQLKELDKNNDGIITMNEIMKWRDEQKTKMVDLERKVEEQLSSKYNKILVEKQGEILEANHKNDELTKQLESIKKINAGLESRLTEAQHHNLQLTEDTVQILSKQRIDEFVEKLLEDKNVNIGYLPDFVERQLYKNILNLIIGLMDNTLSSASVKLLGHELTINIKPEMINKL